MWWVRGRIACADEVVAEAVTAAIGGEAPTYLAPLIGGAAAGAHGRRGVGYVESAGGALGNDDDPFSPLPSLSARPSVMLVAHGASVTLALVNSSHNARTLGGATSLALDGASACDVHYAVFVAVDLDLKLACILKDERPVCGWRSADDLIIS